MWQVVKKGTIGLICKACGHQGMADLRHKLCTYMIKNPPQTFGKDHAAQNKKGGKRGKVSVRSGVLSHRVTYNSLTMNSLQDKESKDHSSEEDSNQNHKQTNGKKEAAQVC